MKKYQKIHDAINRYTKQLRKRGLPYKEDPIVVTLIMYLEWAQKRKITPAGISINIVAEECKLYTGNAYIQIRKVRHADCFSTNDSLVLKLHRKRDKYTRFSVHSRKDKPYITYIRTLFDRRQSFSFIFKALHGYLDIPKNAAIAVNAPVIAPAIEDIKP